MKDELQTLHALREILAELSPEGLRYAAERVVPDEYVRRQKPRMQPPAAQARPCGVSAGLPAALEDHLRTAGPQPHRDHGHVRQD